MAVATPLLALVRGLVGFLTFEASPIAAGDEIDEINAYATFICDDGGPLFDENNLYREECTRDGCGFNDEVCYFDSYFERCLDVYGRSNNRCAPRTTKCKGTLGCLALWIDCGGEYNCENPAIIGCKQGVCSED